ncbi:hypothetical protein [Sporolituus thermophilus]|uniref:Tetratricopeptide repeat-containing protein n=1 Tax=Sporolituus thermophilus DSM 23256 TaxID=1123285 RepID=A0A1G7JAV5_9FIRM|nr:hypothetical protein [Sporolituus thermophilus]SDF22107.1 hypothetical protein SAMN05660235_00861 [Sporolituus thermophilus DSM 23256]
MDQYQVLSPKSTLQWSWAHGVISSDKKASSQGAPTVQEFIRKSGATNTPSLTDKAYREGLEFYWQGYYSKALPKFEEVKRLYAKHSEADDLIAECQNNIAQGKDRRYWPDYYPYLAALAIAAVLVVSLTVYFVIRRRKMAQQGSVLPPPPPGPDTNKPNQPGQ